MQKEKVQNQKGAEDVKLVKPEGVNPETQAAIPGTQLEKDKKPKEPRPANEIERDFRMAKLVGNIEKTTEDWKDGRDYKISITLPGYNNLDGLKRFNGGEMMQFRILPVQPLLDDKEPEEFGTKVPAFGVAMIERLEHKSCEGVNGWEKLQPADIYKRMTLIMRNFAVAPTSWTGASKLVMQKEAVDLANFAFFMWQNAQTQKPGVKQ